MISVIKHIINALIKLTGLYIIGLSLFLFYAYSINGFTLSPNLLLIVNIVVGVALIRFSSNIVNLMYKFDRAL